MPTTIDHELRRRELLEATWRVVLRDGVAAASVRAVAAEAGLSAGSVRYLYDDQRVLLRDAVRELAQRVRGRIVEEEPQRRRLVEAGRSDEAVIRLLRQVLPLAPAQWNDARIWSAFAGVDARDETVQRLRHELDEEVRRLCQQCIESLDQAGMLGAGRQRRHEAMALWALLDGLTVQLLLDSHRVSVQSALALLRRHVRQLSWPAPEST